jgi:para-aminobenzoate synthetase/4-amino-4-deoxychorismate lyase
MTGFDPSRAFVLLDDARLAGAGAGAAASAGAARLYRDPVAVVTAETAPDIVPALDRVRAAVRSGKHVAGWMGYEAGHALEPRLAGIAPATAPLLWFGVFDRCETVDVAALLPDPAGAWAGAPAPMIDEAAHAAAVGRVLALIAAGDIYQANLTFPARVPIAGHPLALYARLRSASRAGWGGVVHDGAGRWLLSLSPELFFTLDGGVLTARPMKGTAPAASDPAALAEDAKQRAENLMIVDLIRNDLSRVAAPASVAVPALFEIESYPTVHQMTSTVTARLAEGRDAIDVLAAIFPCGSVTGAPKIRAMEVIAEVEPFARGAYTGSIGWLDPAGDAAFNVAIRTLVIESREEDHAIPDHATLGLGSAIVADSTAPSEWRECLEKGAFVTAAATRFDLIETMRFDPMAGVVDLDRHFARMKASAELFGRPFNRHDARNELQAATFRLRDARKLRMMLSPSGAVAIEVRPLPDAPSGAVEVAIVPLPVDRADIRLRHKMSDRGFYDDARHASGRFEVLFTDADGYLTEGSFTTIFVERDGVLVTPPLARGLLPGVLRARLIDEGRAIEGDLRPADLAGGFWIGNALRGLIAARVVPAISPAL